MDPNNPGVLGGQPAPAPAPTPTPEPAAAPAAPVEPVAPAPAPEPVMAAAPVAPEPAAPVAPVEPVLGAQPAPAPMSAPMGAPASAPAPKKSNAGIIIAIIVAVLVIAGGIVAAILILNNNNKGNSDDKPSTSQTSNKEEDKDIEDEDEDSDDEDEDEDEEEDEDDDKSTAIQKDDTVATSGTYKDNSAYFININGHKYNYNSRIADLAKSGYEIDKRLEEKNYTVKPNQYLILFGAGLTSKSVSTTVNFTPYNDGVKEVALKDAKLGSITIRAGYSESDKKAIEKITFNGGLHVGSTREQVVKVFGEPTKTSPSGNYEYLEYNSSSFKYYKFTIKDGVVSEITWENFGSLVR